MAIEDLNPDNPNQQKKEGIGDILGAKVNEEYMDGLKMPLERLSQYIEELTAVEEKGEVMTIDSVQKTSLRAKGINIATGLKKVADGTGYEGLWNLADKMEQLLTTPGQFAKYQLISLIGYTSKRLGESLREGLINYKKPSTEVIIVRAHEDIPSDDEWVTVEAPRGQFESNFKPAINKQQQAALVLEGFAGICAATISDEKKVEGGAVKVLGAVAKRAKDPGQIGSDVISAGKWVVNSLSKKKNSPRDQQR